MLAEAMTVDGITLSLGAIIAGAGAIAAYATMRANVQRNTTRVETLETTTIPKLENELRKELKDLGADIRDIEREMDYRRGKERGRSSGDSTTRTWEGRTKR